MKRIAKAIALLLVAAAHAFAFTYILATLGAAASFSALGATGSFLASFIAASLVTSAIATSPLALLAGFIGGKQFILFSVLSFLTVWFSFVLYFQGLSAVTHTPTSISLPVDLLVIAVLCTSFSNLGASLGANNSFKPKPLRGSA